MLGWEAWFKPQTKAVLQGKTSVYLQSTSRYPWEKYWIHKCANGALRWAGDSSWGISWERLQMTATPQKDSDFKCPNSIYTEKNPVHLGVFSAPLCHEDFFKIAMMYRHTWKDLWYTILFLMAFYYPCCWKYSISDRINSLSNKMWRSWMFNIGYCLTTWFWDYCFFLMFLFFSIWQ